jgi:hypothetical protein
LGGRQTPSQRGSEIIHDPINSVQQDRETSKNLPIHFVPDHLVFFFFLQKAFHARQKLRRSKFKETKMALLASLSAQEPDGTTAPGNDSTKGDLARKPNPLLKKRNISGPDNDATSNLVRSSQVLTKAQPHALPTPPKRQKTTSTGAINTDHSGAKTFTHENLEKGPISKNTQDKVKHIVRSTAERTKNARLKAMGKRKLGKSSISS